MRNLGSLIGRDIASEEANLPAQVEQTGDFGWYPLPTQE